MTDAQVHSGLVRWLAARTGLTVIKGHEGGDRPALPYVMVTLLGSSEVRTHEQEVEYVEDEDSGRVMAAPVVETEWRFSTHAYGTSPTDVLRPVRSAAMLAQVNEPMMPNIIIHEVSQIRNVPEYVEEHWEPRAQMDVFLRGLVKDGHLVDTIETYGFEFTRK